MRLSRHDIALVVDLIAAAVFIFVIAIIIRPWE